MTTYAGKGLEIYQLTVLASGLRMYAKTKMQPNRAWTPTRMIKRAEGLTGQKFKARDYIGAADACKAKADEIAAGLAIIANLVGEFAENNYGVIDGADLCYNQFMSGNLNPKHSIETLANQIAQLIEQA